MRTARFYGSLVEGHMMSLPVWSHVLFWGFWSQEGLVRAGVYGTTLHPCETGVKTLPSRNFVCWRLWRLKVWLHWAVMVDYKRHHQWLHMFDQLVFQPILEQLALFIRKSKQFNQIDITSDIAALTVRVHVFLETTIQCCLKIMY